MGKDECFNSLEESSFPVVDQIPTDENAEKGQENRGSSPFEEDKKKSYKYSPQKLNRMKLPRRKKRCYPVNRPETSIQSLKKS